MACFEPTAIESLKAKPLQQIWRDHLLMGSLFQDAAENYSDGFFVFLYPHDNERCAEAAETYGRCLRSRQTFVPWTLETVVAAMRAENAGVWVDALQRRYLEFGRIAV
jgi:hypothetical protein